MPGRKPKYTGIRETPFGTFVSTLVVGGTVRQMCGPNELELALLRDRLARHMGAKPAALNFPERKLRPISFEDAKARLNVSRKKLAASRYFGVIGTRNPGVWQAQVHFEGNRRVLLGQWRSQKDAAVARDRAKIFEEGRDARPLNFPKRSKTLAPASPEAFRREAHGRFKRTTSSRYVGVYYMGNVPGRPWISQYSSRGDEHFLGAWESEKDAAIAHDRACLYYGARNPKLNFPEKAQTLKPADGATLREEAHALKKLTTTSRYRGVSWSRCVWVAAIDTQGRTIRLRRFDDEEEAARAYDAAAQKYHGDKAKPNFAPRRAARKRPRRNTR